MKVVLFLALVIVSVITVIAAVFFRSQRAIAILLFMRKLGWAYVIVIVLVAAYRLWMR